MNQTNLPPAKQAMTSEYSARVIVGDDYLQRMGRRLTPDEIWACRQAAVAAWTAEPCGNSVSEMKILEAHGLVRDVVLLSGRGKYAGRYEYEMTTEGEAVAEAYMELPPKEEPPTD